MDLARPGFKVQNRRRQTIIVPVVDMSVAARSVGVSRLKAAAPPVEQSTVWTDGVKRGSMLRTGIEGVLVDLPLQVGQQVSSGTIVAKVRESNELKKIMQETNA